MQRKNARRRDGHVWVSQEWIGNAWNLDQIASHPTQGLGRFDMLEVILGYNRVTQNYSWGSSDEATKNYVA